MKNLTPIQDFTGTYPKRNTARTYVTVMCRFVESVYGLEKPAPNTPVDFPTYEPLAAGYLEEVRAGKRNPRNDLLKFISQLNNASPITQRKYPSHVLTWFEFHGIDVPAGDRKMIFRRGRPMVPASEDEEHIDHATIRKIIEFSHPQMRALILTLASSGMRLGEALSIKTGDLSLDETPARIRLHPQYCKTGIGRTVFISTEAAAVLKEWMQYRPQYVANKRGPVSCRVDDGRVFPFNDSAALEMWTLALQRAGLYRRDASTNRLTIHPHGLRKFYRRFLPTGSTNAKGIELTEKLMGHAGYLGGVYSRVPVEELADFYRESEAVLWVSMRAEVSSKEMEALAAENEELRARLARLEDEHRRIAEMESRIDAGAIQELIKTQVQEALKMEKERK